MSDPLSFESQPGITCPHCQVRFSQADLLQHLQQLQKQPAPKQMDSCSSSSEVDEAPLFEFASENDPVAGASSQPERLSLGLAYESDLQSHVGEPSHGEDVALQIPEESQGVFRAPAPPRVPTPAPALATSVVIVEDSSLQATVGEDAVIIPSSPSPPTPVAEPRDAESGKRQRPDAAIQELAKNRKAAPVINLDEEVRERSPKSVRFAPHEAQVHVIMVPSSDVEEPVQRPPPEAESIDEPEEVVVEKQPQKRKSKKRVARRREEEEDEEEELVDDDVILVQDNDDEEDSPKVGLESEGSSQLGTALGIAGSGRSTRRRRRGIEDIVGTDVVTKRSEFKVFEELAKAAQTSVAKQSPAKPSPAKAPKKAEGDSAKKPARRSSSSSSSAKNLAENEENAPASVPKKSRKKAVVPEEEGPEYSVIPAEEVGNERIYDLSQPSDLIVDTQQQPPVETRKKSPATPKAKAASAAASNFVSPKSRARPVVAADWIRGHINGHDVSFVEPKNPNKIFAGFQFIVTGCKVVNELDPREKHISFFVNVAQGEGGQRKMVLADWIHDTITSQGGKEILMIDEEVSDAHLQRRLAKLVEPLHGTPFKSNIICISEKPHRTIKWLLSVAAGIPCVKWSWIHECISHGKLMDWNPFLLKKGYSVLEDRMLSYSPVQSDSLVFEGLKVELCGPLDWKGRWSVVLREQGAECVVRLDVGNESSLSFVVSHEDDVYPPPHLIEKCQSLKIPIVTREFVIQCILHHKLLSPHQFPEFVAKRN